MKVLKIVSSVLTLAVMTIAVISAVRYQDISDWWQLRGYMPSERISQLAQRTSMTKKAQTIFYVHDPQIEEKEAFNGDCTIGETSIVLGCYDGRGIYVFDVADPRLDGIQEVTAAHEMLHAAYDRLPEKEKARVDTLTARAVQKVSSERLQNLIKSYTTRSPSSVPNELHSIVGTEIPNLSPELETYYAQYFTDRMGVVKLSQKYEQVFTDIKAQVDRLDAELSLIQAQITDQETSLKYQNDVLKAKKRSLESLLNSQSTAAYNAAVGPYNASVNDYNESIVEYKNLIADYNEKVLTRNSLSVEQNDLVKAINSKAESL